MFYTNSYPSRKYFNDVNDVIGDLMMHTHAIYNSNITQNYLNVIGFNVYDNSPREYYFNMLFTSDIASLLIAIGTPLDFCTKECLPLVLFMHCSPSGQKLHNGYDNRNELEKTIIAYKDSIMNMIHYKWMDRNEDSLLYIEDMLLRTEQYELLDVYLKDLLHIIKIVAADKEYFEKSKSVIKVLNNYIDTLEMKYLNDTNDTNSTSVNSNSTAYGSFSKLQKTSDNELSVKQTIDYQDNPYEQLQDLIGLDIIKKDVLSLSNLVKAQQMRQSRGMKVAPMSYHCVFTGNPGTGKTTVARILARIYKGLGIIRKGQLIETDRSGLVADYVGQTATKTNKIIDSALDGVLFIDEAYSLSEGGQGDYGKEAIATLLKRMEDDRGRLIVILAGYSEEMSDFLKSNSGLQSRFSRYFDFPDYTPEELLQIFKLKLLNNGCKATPEALDLVQSYIEETVAIKDKYFGNARFVRNLVEAIITTQANRLSCLKHVSDEVLSTIESIDITTTIK